MFIAIHACGKMPREIITVQLGQCGNQSKEGVVFVCVCVFIVSDKVYSREDCVLWHVVCVRFPIKGYSKELREMEVLWKT